MSKEKLIQSMIYNGTLQSKEIEKAIRAIPREEFVLPENQEYAYIDNAQPIISGQTISQPSTIVTMLELLELQKGQKILEIGAGSGYNASLMGVIIGEEGKIYSADIIPKLIVFAKDNIARTQAQTNIDLGHIKIFQSDGSIGYEEKAPYDRIIATAACPERSIGILFEQLKDQGVMVLPIDHGGFQVMTKIRKNGDTLSIEDHGNFVFVPLTGKKGLRNF